MTSYRAESAALKHIISELQSLTAYANELITNVEQLAQGVSASWSGPANQQYLAAQAEWNDGARQMSEALAPIHARAANSAGNYDAVADGLRTMWS